MSTALEPVGEALHVSPPVGACRWEQSQLGLIQGPFAAAIGVLMVARSGVRTFDRQPAAGQVRLKEACG